MSRRSPREWFEVLDKESGVSWCFDMTFLLSRYNCIFGRGCQGGFGSKPEGCCGDGAYLSSDKDMANVREKAQRLTSADQDRVPLKRVHDPKAIVTKGGQHKTRKLDGSCVFATTTGACSLHAAALRLGERPIDWKPEICWTIPLKIDEDAEGDVWVTVWDRNDHSGWNTSKDSDGKAVDGNEGYWCADDPNAYASDNQIAADFFGEELERLVPPYVHKILRNYIGDRAVKGMLTPLKSQPVSVFIVEKKEDA